MLQKLGTNRHCVRFRRKAAIDRVRRLRPLPLWERDRKRLRVRCAVLGEGYDASVEELGVTPHPSSRCAR